MRTSLHRFPAPSNRGLSIWEVVIALAILGVLVFVLSWPVYNSVRVSAKRSRGMSMTNDLHTAVVNYYTEYHAYPFEYTGEDARLPGGTDPAGWVELASTLSGNKNPKTFTDVPNPTLNHRNIAFISFRPEQLDDAGAPISPHGISRGFWQDEAPYYYALVADTDLDGTVNPDNAGTPLEEGVAVWLPEHPEVKGSIPQIGTFKKQEPR